LLIRSQKFEKSSHTKLMSVVAMQAIGMNRYVWLTQAIRYLGFFGLGSLESIRMDFCINGDTITSQTFLCKSYEWPRDLFQVSYLALPLCFDLFIFCLLHLIFELQCLFYDLPCFTNLFLVYTTCLNYTPQP
jgi:hypothetical protein